MLNQKFNRDSASLKTETLMNPKYDMAKQKMKELFLLWLSEDRVFDFVGQGLDDKSLLAAAPAPVQEDLPIGSSALNKSFTAPPVNKKKDAGGMLSKTIVPEPRNYNDDSRIGRPKMSLLKTTREEHAEGSNVMNLNFILLTNCFGEAYNEKEETIVSMFKSDKMLSLSQLKYFTTKVLELPEHFYVYLSDLSGLNREDEEYRRAGLLEEQFLL